MMKITRVLLLSIYLAVIHTEALTFTQRWKAPEGEIPILQIKKDCSGGLITEISVKPTTDADLSTCTFMSLYENILKHEILTCYNTTKCTKIPWDREGFLTGCGNVDGMIGEGKLEVIVTITCDIPEDLTLYSLEHSRNIDASRPLCSDGENQRIKHMFTITPCPKPLVEEDRARYALDQLAAQMENCGETCPLINVDNYQLDQPSCAGQEVGVPALGVYWSCSNLVTKRPVVAFTTGSTLSGGSKTGKYSEDELDNLNQYKIAMIVMSLLFALCLLALVGIVLWFCCFYKRKSTMKVSRPFDEAPPSRQALYERSSAGSKFTSSRPVSGASTAVSERYITDKNNRANQDKESEYSVPMLDGETPYYNVKNDQEDVYEVIDTDKLGQGETTPKRTNTSNSQGYMMMNKYKKPQRAESEKYSDGYLLPSSLQKKVVT